MAPWWFTALSCTWLAIGVASAAWMTVEALRNPPMMRVMGFVWPLCALFAGPPLIWFHARHGGGHADDDTPFAAVVAKGTLHCGAGCALGDMIAETLALAAPAMLIPLGWPGLFGDRIFAVWILDFILAFGIGVVFQFFAIAPMRDLGLLAGLRAALKADAASLAAWQVGMYGVMGAFHFGLFEALWGVEIDATRPEFWFAMQIAMLAGFVTAFPVNARLIRAGVKERM